MSLERMDAPGRYDSIYLSPHLDDVALSCAAGVMTAREAGRRVLVVTAFSHPGEADAGPFRRALYPVRWAEEEAAMATLEVDHRLLGLRDAPFRDPLYHDFRGILFGRSAGDAAVLDELAYLLAGLLKSTGATRLFAPLGVGEHIDHRLCHEAAQMLATATPKPPETSFYEDRPYAWVRHAVHLRLRVLGATKRPLNEAELEDHFGSLFDSAMGRAFLAGEENRQACREGIAALLREAAGASPLGAGVRVHHYPAEMAQRVAAVVCCYDSQLGDILGGDRYAELALNAARREGERGYIERLWTIGRAP